GARRRGQGACAQALSRRPEARRRHPQDLLLRQGRQDQVGGEIQAIKATLPAAVRAEIENNSTEVAHKIGILTLREILERLEKLAEHIKAHPEEARAGVAKLSAAAQKPAGDIIRIFVSDKTPKEKWAECKAIKDTLSSEVLGEINAHKEEIAHKIGVVPVHYH
ncbi:hypothetical protein PFISCL1PPCAC_22587, partial [Pristionchus fissidentatus]